MLHDSFGLHPKVEQLGKVRRFPFWVQLGSKFPTPHWRAVPATPWDYELVQCSNRGVGRLRLNVQRNVHQPLAILSGPKAPQRFPLKTACRPGSARSPADRRRQRSLCPPRRRATGSGSRAVPGKNGATPPRQLRVGRDVQTVCQGLSRRALRSTGISFLRKAKRKRCHRPGYGSSKWTPDHPAAVSARRTLLAIDRTSTTTILGRSCRTLRAKRASPVMQISRRKRASIRSTGVPHRSTR